ncbi:hypothetical protein A2841_01255 [Candidatus Kaiserbacteria bacterium RIFCSPHIGHO2_01_FULL_48_10]|uniref:Uncharacterized protein n=1 Tax=Candidatus Kaiserbacteria bacterium RIFCSPHIGHO2_01_FULL_48_10 TaxID=1798476 RepID=A0A1F6C1V6_9BACT|nr:MAG: hypothetical protein A2841_01255 [Candidatus Kaiserbacteria bacterium RIFCSPHIGHO2_01_FULL_48_10]
MDKEKITARDERKVGILAGLVAAKRKNKVCSDIFVIVNYTSLSFEGLNEVILPRSLEVIEAPNTNVRALAIMGMAFGLGGMVHEYLTRRSIQKELLSVADKNEKAVEALEKLFPD